MATDSLVDSLINGTTALANGELVRVSANNTASRAQANSTSNLVGFFGAVQASSPIGNGGRAPIAISGAGFVLLETGLTPVAGDTIYVSPSVAGRGTTVAPSSNALPIGVVVDTSSYATRSLVGASIGGPVLAGTSSTAMSLLASWTAGATRFYAVDYVNGVDTNLGYSDVSMAAAGAVAIKTLTKLKEIIPPFAQGQRLCVAVKSASDNQSSITYYKPDGATLDDLDFRGLTGYQMILARTTQDFTDSATDKIVCGPVVALAGPGTNGVFTVAGGATTSVFSISSGTLTAEPGVLGYRIRFTGNVTAALANQCRNVYKNSSTQITVGLNTSVAPAAGDTFYIEKPGVIINNVYGPAAAGGGGTSTQKALYEFGTVGFYCAQSNAVSRQNVHGGSVGWQAAFMEFATGLEAYNLTAFNAIESYLDTSTSNTAIVVGFGVRVTTVNSQDLVFANVSNIVCSTFLGSDFIVNGGPSALIGRGCVFYQSSLSVFSIAAAGHAYLIGRHFATSYQYMRCAGGAVVKLNNGSNVDLREIDVSGAGSASCIQCANASNSGYIRIAEITSVDGGNNAYVLDMLATTLGAKFKTINMDLGIPTATATLGDIRCGDGTVITFASVNADQIVDGNCNTYIGASSGTRIKRFTPGIFYNVPILGADPTTPSNGDVWITNIAGTRQICAHISGTTYRTTLT